MTRLIHIVLSVALTMCSFGFALDKPTKAKSNQSTLSVPKDIKIDKKDIGKNPRLEKAERVKADKLIEQNRVQYLRPNGRAITNKEALKRFGPGALNLELEGVVELPKRSRKDDLLMENIPSSRDELWNLSYMNESDAYYYLGSGGASDTFATVFSPAAPCVVQEVYYQWFSAGNTIAFGADYGNASLISPDGDCYNIARGEAFHVAEGSTDTTWVTPIGNPRTTATPNTIAGYVSDWSSDAFLDIGGTFVVGDSTDLSAVDQFVIVAIKGGDTPQPLACSNSAIGKTTSYTWFGGPWTTNQWGRYSDATDNMVLVKVTYPWGAPIAVASMSQPSNTYESTGTRTIDVDLFDDEDDAGIALDANDALTYYYVANGDTSTGALTASAAVATNGNGIYQFDISYTLSVGDSVQYWVDLVDNDGLESKSAIQYFNIVKPWNEASDILLVVDNIDVDQESVLFDAMDNTGFVFEVWDVQVNKGIDASVINHGWTNIIVSGWGVSSVPVTDQPDPGYRTFVEDGYNLVLMDMDFFYGHGLDPEPVFVEGDFMYDVFGISGGGNDPMNDAGTASLHGDTLTVYGAAVTSFDTPFTDGYTQNHTILMTAGWTDLIEANDADEIFYDEDDNVVGTNLQSGDNGTAIYLAFMPEAAVDWYIVDGDTMGWDISSVDQFMGALIGYLGAVSPPLVDLAGSSTHFGVASGITTAHVDGMAVDGDGTLTSVSVVYDIDGTDYTEAMTDDGDGHYSATLTLTAWTDSSICNYQLSATDNDGLTSTTGIGQFWGTTLVPVENILYIEDSYGPYAGYGPADADSVLRQNMDAAGVEYDKWVVWDNYQPDFGSVLSHYDAVIYSAVLDWVMNPEETDIHPLGEFVDGGGFLLYSSNEALGTYTDWEDISLSEGHFAYDVLGVEWVGNDISYDTVLVGDDVAVTTDIGTDSIALNCYTYPFDCSFNDIVDPLGYGTDDMLPSPFNAANTQYGEYYASSENGNVVFMGFLFPELPNGVQQAVLSNFLAWSGSTVSNEDELNLPTEFALYENYPNPFNPVTTIRFDVPEISDVNIRVFNVLGKEVNSFDLNTMSPGTHHIKWRGIDNAGKPVSSGLYFYTIKAGDFFATKKMMLLK